MLKKPKEKPKKSRHRRRDPDRDLLGCRTTAAAVSCIAAAARVPEHVEGRCDSPTNKSFHHNLPHHLSIFSLNVHHVNALGHLRKVDDGLIAFMVGIIDRLAEGVDDADMA